MKITKQYLKQLIMEEVGPVRGQTNSNQLQHMYPGQGNLKNFPTGEPPDNNTRDRAATRPPYETLGIKVEYGDGDVFVTSGKTRYKVWFESDSEHKRVNVLPVDEYSATVEGEKITWDGNTPAFVQFDPHLDKFIKEFTTIDVDNNQQEEVKDED